MDMFDTKLLEVTNYSCYEDYVFIWVINSDVWNILFFYVGLDYLNCGRWLIMMLWYETTILHGYLRFWGDQNNTIDENT